MATGYQLSELTGLLCDLRDDIDPAIIERIMLRAESMSNSEADGIIRILLDAKKEREG